MPRAEQPRPSTSRGLGVPAEGRDPGRVAARHAVPRSSPASACSGRRSRGRPDARSGPVDALRDRGAAGSSRRGGRSRRARPQAGQQPEVVVAGPQAPGGAGSPRRPRPSARRPPGARGRATARSHEPHVRYSVGQASGRRTPRRARGRASGSRRSGGRVAGSSGRGPGRRRRRRPARRPTRCPSPRSGGPGGTPRACSPARTPRRPDGRTRSAVGTAGSGGSDGTARPSGYGGRSADDAPVRLSDRIHLVGSGEPDLVTTDPLDSQVYLVRTADGLLAIDAGAGRLGRRDPGQRRRRRARPDDDRLAPPDPRPRRPRRRWAGLAGAPARGPVAAAAEAADWLAARRRGGDQRRPGPGGRALPGRLPAGALRGRPRARRR